MSDHTIRLRRTRENAWSRNLIAENFVRPEHLILPIFIVEGRNIQEKIPNFETVYRYSIDNAVKYAKQAAEFGLAGVILFPCHDISLKDENASYAQDPQNLICRAVAEIRKDLNSIGIFADVALDPYTPHGQDGILVKSRNGYSIDNDKTVEILTDLSLNLAKAGCDVVSPSDMMDGRVQKIRQRLEENKYVKTMIASYSAKYASNLYAGFRNAVGSNSSTNYDVNLKKTYQCDFRNAGEALYEIERDIQEEVDFIIMKPATLSLDIMSRIQDKYFTPMIAYEVSGEYMMLNNFSKETGINKFILYNEYYTTYRRAGASGIISYGALEFAQNFELIT